MIYNHAQLFKLMPNDSASKPKENTTESDLFFKIFDRSLNAGNSRVQRTGIENQGKTEAMHSQRPSTEGNDIKASSTRPNPSSNQNSMKREPLSTVGKAARKEPTPVKEANPEQKEELFVQVEKLQEAMDDIVALLQQVSNTISEVVIDGDEVQGSTSVDIPTLKQELASKLETLMASVESLVGTKTSETALQFASKLQQMLGDNFTQLFGQDDIQITVQNVEKLHLFVDKMLQEAESARMHITKGAISEIVIPVMNERLAQPILTNASDEATIVQQIPVEEQEMVQQAADASQSGQTDKGSEQKLAGQKLPASISEDAKPVDAINHADVIPMENYQGIQNSDSVPSNLVKIQDVLKPQAILQQVVEKAETLVSDNKSEVVMQLKPESLGKISLKVIHERGEIIAKFVAENEQVKSILENNLQLLKDSLEKSGVAVQSMSVSVGQQGQEQHNEPDGRQQTHHNQRQPMTNSIEEPLVQPTYRNGGLAAAIIQSHRSEINLTA